MRENGQVQNKKQKQLYYIRGYYYNPRKEVFQLITDFVEAESEKEAKKLAENLYKKIGRSVKIADVMSYDVYEYVYGPEM